jgi:hypothetical protein
MASALSLATHVMVAAYALESLAMTFPDASRGTTTTSTSPRSASSVSVAPRPRTKLAAGSASVTATVTFGMHVDSRSATYAGSASVALAATHTSTPASSARTAYVPARSIRALTRYPRPAIRDSSVLVTFATITSPPPANLLGAVFSYATCSSPFSASTVATLPYSSRRSTSNTKTVPAAKTVAVEFHAPSWSSASEAESPEAYG